jgi:hypothetical protein
MVSWRVSIHWNASPDPYYSCPDRYSSYLPVKQESDLSYEAGVKASLFDLSCSSTSLGFAMIIATSRSARILLSVIYHRSARLPASLQASVGKKETMVSLKTEDRGLAQKLIAIKLAEFYAS